MSIMIRRGSSYLERVPYDGRWSWLAASATHAARFRDDHAEFMLARLAAVGVTDAVLEGDDRSSTVLSTQVEHGEIDA